MPTVLDLIKDTPEFKAWDNWDIRVHGPVSTDDLAEVTVTLIHQDRTRHTLHVPLVTK